MAKFFYIAKVIFAGAFMWVIFNLAVQIRIQMMLEELR